MVHILRLFGINRERAPELRGSVWPAVASLSSDSAPFSSIVSNDGLKSLRGCLRGDVLGSYFSLVARASGGKCVAMDDCLSDYMPGSKYGALRDVRIGLQIPMANRHLSRTILGPVHVPHHWLATITEPTIPPSPSSSTRNETLLDPLGLAYALRASRSAVTSGHEEWLRNEMQRASMPPLVFSVSLNPVDLSCQNDAISCGAFACLYVFFYVMFGRLPTSAEINGDDNIALRLAILDALVTGCIRRRSEVMESIELESIPDFDSTADINELKAIRAQRAEKNAAADTSAHPEVIDLCD